MRISGILSDKILTAESAEHAETIAFFNNAIIFRVLLPGIFFHSRGPRPKQGMVDSFGMSGKEWRGSVFSEFILFENSGF
jgi:hypothetical protein